MANLRMLVARVIQRRPQTPDSVGTGADRRPPPSSESPVGGPFGCAPWPVGQDGQDRRRSAVAYILALGLLLAGIGWWLAHHNSGGQWDVDEGIYLMWTQLWRAGYPLYSVVWTDQPPGFIAGLRLAFDLFGPSLAVARVVPVIYALLGLAGVAWLVRELGGGCLASLVAVVILVITPDFFWLSRAIIADLPAMSLVVLGLASAVHYLRIDRRVWLLVSGLLFGLALSVKLIIAPALLPLGAAILVRYWGKDDWLRGVVTNGLVLGASLMAAFAITLIGVDVSGLLDQVLGTYVSGRSGYAWSLTEQVRKYIWPFVVDRYFGLTAMTLFGLWGLFRRGWRPAWVAVSWLGIILLTLLTHTPLWARHHMVLLLFPMSVLAAMTVDGLLFRRPGGGVQIRWVLVGCVAVGLFLINLPQMLAADRELLKPSGSWDMVQMAQLTRELTRPSDFVMTDSPMIAFLADRLVPPDLADISRKRVRAGSVTGQDLVAAGETYRPQVIALWRGLMTGFPEFDRWMRQHYRRVVAFDQQRQVYVRFDPSQVAPVQLQASFDQKATLLGYNVSPVSVHPGDELELTLLWRAEAPMDLDYNVFTHLVDPGPEARTGDQGRLWGQHDGPPQDGEFLTNHWPPGEHVVDVHRIRVSPDAPPGAYTLAVGLYDWRTGQRLPAYEPDGTRVEGDAVVLGQVRVVAP